MKAHVVVETPISQSARARQLESMFDVPVAEKSRLEWTVDLPIEGKPWNVGLILGPSGSGKTTVARKLFGDAIDRKLRWRGAAVIDDFPAALPIADLAGVCQAVGFNTIPAWLRPYSVLSNGEKFRVELARRLIEPGDPIVVDEFTSVVDRQVAQIGSHAVQKHVRRTNRRFVAVSCHYDIVDWLQPDWTFEPASGAFAWRSLQRRPPVECVIGRVPHAAWKLFAPYHYLTGELHRSARCFGLWADGKLAAFGGVIPRPHPTRRGLFGLSRMVTLPDYQGLGLAFVLMDALGAAYKGAGHSFRIYPAHPPFVRSVDRSPKWALMRKLGLFSARTSSSKTSGISGGMGGRPCAVFEYCGPALDSTLARALISAKP